jgi:hypothetical protein
VILEADASVDAPVVSTSDCESVLEDVLSAEIEPTATREELARHTLATAAVVELAVSMAPC